MVESVLLRAQTLIKNLQTTVTGKAGDVMCNTAVVSPSLFSVTSL